ncbi:MAG: prephenate dehydrogenase [Anaerolineae bacterium]
MSASKPRISIVGLGLIGGSMGLALRQAEVASSVIGHDRDPHAGREAKKLGAVDRVEWNLISACEGSDFIILATPVGAIEETLEAIAPYLRPGCVVMDTASLKGPVLAWADQHLSEQVHFVGGDPILSATVKGQGGLAAARADLFQGGLFCLVPAATTDSDAVKLAADLVSLLGAKPFFMDVEEHDGLLAAVDHVPMLLALALVETLIRQPAWRELRKVAGPAFEASTQLITSSSAGYSDLFVLNRDNVVRWIDELSASLDSIRGALVEEEMEALVDRFLTAQGERQKWLAIRATGEWHEGPRTEMPDRMSVIDTLLGTFWRRKPKKDKS